MSLQPPLWLELCYGKAAGLGVRSRGRSCLFRRGSKHHGIVRSRRSERLHRGREAPQSGSAEFVQAVQEVAEDIFEFIEDKEQYHRWQILRPIAEPDRVVSFRVVWQDDNNNIRVQRGWRVQNNNAIGPYKGGIRFTRPSPNRCSSSSPSSRRSRTR
jgi:hypothetical protein